MYMYIYVYIYIHIYIYVRETFMYYVTLLFLQALGQMSYSLVSIDSILRKDSETFKTIQTIETIETDL